MPQAHGLVNAVYSWSSMVHSRTESYVSVYTPCYWVIMQQHHTLIKFASSPVFDYSSQLTKHIRPSVTLAYNCAHETDSSTFWSHCHGQSCLRARFEQTRLLQRSPGRFAEVYHYSSITCTECGCQTCVRLGPRDHITSALHQLHWHPVQQQIRPTCKLYLLM